MYRPKFVLDDFTDSLYASKSTIAFGDTCEENCVNLLRSMEYVDPRGGINIGNNKRYDRGFSSENCRQSAAENALIKLSCERL